MAYVLGDSFGYAWQYRRVDGQHWQNGLKAYTLKGSIASWPIGMDWAEDFSCIAFCEGGKDGLSAYHFVCAEGKEDTVAPVWFYGSGRINDDAVPLFAGKHVRFFRHLDDAGHSAVETWHSQLKHTASRLNVFNFRDIFMRNGQEVGDLNDLCHIGPALFENHYDLREVMP